jgi:hypothetical protein
MELSYLKPEELFSLLNEIAKQKAIPFASTKAKIYSQEGKLDANVMDAIITEEKKESREGHVAR